MIANKVKIPFESMTYIYNNKYDILDVYIGKVVPVVSEEIYYGVYNHFDRRTDELVGISIMDYTKRNKKFLESILPFSIDFNYIQSNVIN